MPERVSAIESGINAYRTSDAARLLKLLTWFSPAFPVGGYAYSHGLEYAVETGRVRDCATLAAWIEGILRYGGGRIDACFVARAYDAEAREDDDALAHLLDLAAAWRSTSEFALGNSVQGQAFSLAVAAGWPHPRLIALSELARRLDRPLSHAVVVGVAAALVGIDRDQALLAFLQTFAANLVSAGVRLIPLGQSDGLKAIADLEAVVAEVSAEAINASPDALGSSALMVDWTSMRHEQQYTRLFRS